MAGDVPVVAVVGGIRGGGPPEGLWFSRLLSSWLSATTSLCLLLVLLFALEGN